MGDSKIEEGCTAIVLPVKDSSPTVIDANIGKIVKVGKFIGMVESCRKKDFWETNIPIIFYNYSTETSERYLIEGSRLRRLDGNKETNHKKECEEWEI